MVAVGVALCRLVEVFKRVGGGRRPIDGRVRSTACPSSQERWNFYQALDQFGSRVKAATRSSAQGQPSAMRKVVRRAERTSTPAVCKSV